ncbi:prephenate dehydrogenase/arogenate dehydrogenase family protein [Parapusillimonas sp. SGNA-6]|nr:prephenate dehydrogenase/arogenate dehydrogenase family protein [Parapusillimonas sp. SGNA-6]
MTPEQPNAQSGPLVPVLAVVGVGLIGGSFAAALRAAGAVGRVLGVGRSPSSLARAVELGLIDEAVSLGEAARQADVILLSMPVGATAEVLAELQPLLRPGTLVTDAGSTKMNVVAAARSTLGPRIDQFIPAHPIAGAETTGPEAANAALYRGRNVVVTPLAENSLRDRQRLSRLWEACGARVMSMEPDVHDTMLASVSHLPHLLSSAFMWQVATAEDSDLRLSLAGSGFRDFTRIAAGSAEVWRDIFMANRSAVLAELQQVKAALSRAEQALQESDADRLQEFLECAAVARRFWGSRSGLS